MSTGAQAQADQVWHEPLTVFFPDGLVFILEPREIDGFFALMAL